MRRREGIVFGKTSVPSAAPAVEGRFVELLGEEFYLIDHAEQMRPFLMTIVSDADHWLFVTSTGALTAGRRNPGLALFPYVTEDKLVDSRGVSGPVSALLVARRGSRSLWHPFQEADRLAYRLTRRLYKNLLGNRLVFEESNADLGLTFRYGWRTSAQFGFVRECSLQNDHRAPVEVQVLDGLLNILPANVDPQLQLGYSCLLDAYKSNELLPGSTLAVYALAAQPVDRPEPCESLKATGVWSHGLPRVRVHLSADRLASFDVGRDERPPGAVRGLRGAYLMEAQFSLPAEGKRQWLLVADVDRSQSQVSALRARLERPEALVAEVRADVERGHLNLLQIVAATDGLQLTGDRLSAAHHLGSVLFNDLRGGVYADGYQVSGRDFGEFVRRSNQGTWARHRAFLEALGEHESAARLISLAAAQGDPDLERHAQEYLPLTFSRRHGDPSRPWNGFDIQVRDEQGNRILNFEGNWRDIFQNWEALSLSYPEFLEQVIAKFVNASTVDGHNPYRITRAGIDWEVPDPDHPWSTIGYWGDHQIIYLLKLLELSLEHHPEKLRTLLQRALFSYANVPYEIRPFRELLADPRSTIRFDAEKEARIRALTEQLGSDGKLLLERGRVVHVTLLEKLLVAVLAKVSNFVPGGGIWLNTQRPEWNDANNALVGHGLSMVTLYYLARFLTFLPRLLGPLRGQGVPLSREVRAWMEGCAGALQAHRAILEERSVPEAARASLVRALGEVASEYRAGVYRQGFSGSAATGVDQVLDFVALCQEFLAHTIALGRRKDGLYHSYNVLVPRGAEGGLGVEHLYEMLEGQVAVLSSGTLDAREASELLGALARSRMYRPDQHSYLLYPDRQLPGFLKKNLVPARAVRASALLSSLASSGDERILRREGAGGFRFHETLTNGDRCREALLGLRKSSHPDLSDREIAQVLELYEEVFHHREFTGRSGSMFAYEGLGSVYWHMVGKLLVAAQECFLAAVDGGAPARVRARLADHYFRIRDGVGGFGKSPAIYGAFPLDPYSHTPAHAGAQQPGMTGHVKEEILARFGELGVRVREGRLSFRPLLLRRREFLESRAVFEPFDVEGERRAIRLPPGTLAFTYCQVPVIYHLAERPGIHLECAGVMTRDVAGEVLDEESSAAVFERSGRIRRIDVFTSPGR